MKKNLYKVMALAAVTLGVSGAADAQVIVRESAVSVTEFTCDPTTKYTSDWRDNWFIQLGAGINQPFVERGIGNAHTGGPVVNRHKMTAVYNFGFGHWFSPYLAFRVNALGGALHWDCPTEKGNGWTRGKHANLNVELMWDMFNSICGPDEDRVFSIIPYVGIGGDCLWDIRDKDGGPAAATNIYRRNSNELRKMSWTLPVSAGLQFRFRLCAYVDFFAEIRSNFYGDNWNLVADGDPIEANVSCYGGLSFNIGERSFKAFNECNYLTQIAELNNQVNSLRADLLNSAQVIAGLEAQLPCPEVVVPEPQIVQQTIVVNEDSPLLATVRFTIGSDVISPEEMVNVYNMAEWMKANPDRKVVINGYADKDTGTAEFNLALSKKRAEKVYDVMTNYYGINPNRLTVKYEGSNVQPYDVNNWNRIVVFTQDN